MINPIALRLGPLEIHWYAIFIVTGLVIAVLLAMREAPRKQILPDQVIDLILYAFPIAIVGARIYYVIFQLPYYSKHPAEIIAIWNGGLAIYGGLIAGFIVLLIYCRHHQINPFDFLDIAAPGVLIAQSFGRWGNFFNQEAYGKIVTSLNYLPSFIRKQMYIDGAYRLPTFLYESVWNIIGFVIILILRRQKKWLRQGEVLFFYLIWYGCGRFVIEGMRTDSLMFGPIRFSQFLSAVLVLLAIIMIIKRRRRGVPLYN